MSTPVGDQLTYGNKEPDLDYSMEIDVEIKAVEMSMKALYLIRGLPNTGKSTTGYILLELYQAAGRTCVMIEANDYVYHPENVTDDEERFGKYVFDQEDNNHYHELCLQKTISEMRNDDVEAVIVCNTFTEYSELSDYIKAAEELNRSVFVLGVENFHGQDNGRGVGLGAINNMNARFQSFQVHPRLLPQASNQEDVSDKDVMRTTA